MNILSETRLAGVTDAVISADRIQNHNDAFPGEHLDVESNLNQC